MKMSVQFKNTAECQDFCTSEILSKYIKPYQRDIRHFFAWPLKTVKLSHYQIKLGLYYEAAYIKMLSCEKRKKNLNVKRSESYCLK